MRPDHLQLTAATDEWTVGHDIDGWPEPTVQGTCEVSIPGQVDSSGYVVIYDWEGSPDQCDVEPCEDWTGSATPDPDDNYWEGEIVADGNGGHQLVIDDYCVYTGFEDPAVGTATFELDEVATDSWQASADHLIHDPAGFYGIAWWYQTGTFDPISLQIIDDV